MVFLGGQFKSEMGGQFESATHGQFKSAQGGQFNRILQPLKQDHSKFRLKSIKF